MLACIIVVRVGLWLFLIGKDVDIEGRASRSIITLRNQSNGDLSWGSTTDIRTDGTFTTSSGSWNGYGGSKRAPSNRNMFYEQVCGDVILLHESGLLQLRSNGNTITEQINLGSGGIPSNASLHSQGVAYCPLNNKSILVYQYASGSTYYNRALYIVGQIG